MMHRYFLVLQVKNDKLPQGIFEVVIIAAIPQRHLSYSYKHAIIRYPFIWKPDSDNGMILKL